MDYNYEKKTDNFWYNQPSILWDSNRFIEFFPNPDLTLAEKLNALVRLSFYIAIVLIIFYGNYLYIYIPIVVLAFTYFIYLNYRPKEKKELEDYKSLLNAEDPRYNEDIDQITTAELTGQIDTSIGDIKINPIKCTEPSINNPFMNINLITDKRNRDPGCLYFDNENVAANVENDFQYNLYRDVSDLYNKRNSQRQYYTMPSTTIPNEQTAFAKWLYLSPPTCKEDPIRCVPETTQPPLPGVDLNSLELKG